jgi:hypothetical protein
MVLQVMNIEFHGFDLPWGSEKRNDLLHAVWAKMFSVFGVEQVCDHVVTIVEEQTQDRHGRFAPFIRVFSDEGSDFRKVVGMLSDLRLPGAGMRTHVECVLLHGIAVL